MATRYSAAQPEPLFYYKKLISLALFIAAVVAGLGYPIAINQAEIDAVKATGFYHQCQQELATATYDRVSSWSIETVCYAATLGHHTSRSPKHAAIIAGALRPEADHEHIEATYLNPTQRYAEPSWNPLRLPMHSLAPID